MIASLRLRGVARYAVVAALALASCRSTSPSKVGSPAPQPVTRLGQFKAVLINGGGRAAINFQSHLTHVRTLVEFLRAHDVSEHDIVIFSSDGDDPAADLTTRALDSEPDTWLLPPGVAHRLRPDTADRLRPPRLHPASGHARSAARLVRDRRPPARQRRHAALLRHRPRRAEQEGSRPTTPSCSGSESLPVSELRELLELLDPGVRVVMLMSQCFSGSFANALFDAGHRADRPTATSAATSPPPPTARPTAAIPENRGLDGVGHSHHFFDGARRPRPHVRGREPRAGDRRLAGRAAHDVGLLPPAADRRRWRRRATASRARSPTSSSAMPSTTAPSGSRRSD